MGGTIIRNLRFFAWALLFLLHSLSCLAVTVNPLNGGANIIYIDFSIPGPMVPLELARTYNSITAINEKRGWKGAFGWGWTSPLESQLITTPDRQVILRDGGSGNTVVFRAEKEEPKIRQQFFKQLKQAYFERVKGKRLSSAELKALSFPENVQIRLEKDAKFRAEMASKYKIDVPIPRGELLVSSEYGYQTIRFRNNKWVREKNGTTQVFDQKGRLIRQADKNGFYFDFIYADKNKEFQVSQIRDQNQSMSLKFTWEAGRISRVVDNRGVAATYSYDGLGNLVQVKDSSGQVYEYKYEEKKFPHLLTRINYVTESQGNQPVYREMRYDSSGMVSFHQDKKGVKTSYKYGRDSRNPKTHFWTKTTIVQPDGGKFDIFDEYYLKRKSDGSNYLYKQVHRGASTTTVTVYNECCGQPSQIVQNGLVTNFKYYENGLLKERIGPEGEVRFKYHPKWNKPSTVTQAGLVSNYKYDDKGNLIEASNSRNEKVYLSYDKQGRVKAISDHKKRNIFFKYGDDARPEFITQSGVGTIRLSYAGGRVVGAETVSAGSNQRKPSAVEAQKIVNGVQNGFQEILSVLRPAGLGQANLF